MKNSIYSMNSIFGIICCCVFLLLSCQEEDVDSKDESVDEENVQKIEKDLTGNIDILSGTIDDYIIYSEIDNSKVDIEQQFEIGSHSVLIATNKKINKPVYFGIPENESSNYKLNAKETALYFALQGIPNIRRKGFRANIGKIKSALYEFEEVKDLEQAITTSIKQNGYLNYNEVGVNIGKAIDKVIDELGFASSMSFSSARAKWNDKYSAGRGFYRVAKETPGNWKDKIDESSGTYTMQREFHNNTPALVGLKIEQYNFNKNTVNQPFQYDYIGFIEPFYPPNLLSLDGTKDNIKQWAEATSDIYKNGWDGLANTDAYSESAIFEFEAKKGERDAFVFVNGYYDVYVNVANVIYLIINNLSETDFYKKLGGENVKPIFGQLDGAFINSFIKWVIENNSSNLSSYLTWFNNKQFDLLISDIHHNLSQFLSEQTNDEKVNSLVLSGVKDFVDNQFVNLAGSIGKSYEFSRKLFETAGYLLISSSPRYAATIPIEFDEVTQPPFPFKPYPINVQLNNVYSTNFTWAVDNSNNQILKYDFYLGIDPQEMNLIASNLDTNNLKFESLLPNKRYFWKVVVQNANGQRSEGAIWTFDNGSSKLRNNKFPKNEKIFVKGGNFMLGNNEYNAYQVKLNDFYISKYEVTYAQYVEFLNSEGNQIEAGSPWVNTGAGYLIYFENGVYQVKEGFENLPVSFVTWYGARAYTIWVGGRLPTEAEWEYAARGGQYSKGYKYSGSNDANEVAWHKNNSPDSFWQNRVGQKLPNELGIYDMSGNLMEWCNDWLHSSYSYDTNLKHNPLGSLTGSVRALRGSSFGYSESLLEVYRRNGNEPSVNYFDNGFRVVFDK